MHLITIIIGNKSLNESSRVDICNNISEIFLAIQSSKNQSRKSYHNVKNFPVIL